MYNYQSTMNWCCGEAGAKSYPVAPGNTVPIFDSEDQTFYIKSVDVMGKPLPLKVYDYIERCTEEVTYVERSAFDNAIASINEKLDALRKEKKDAK